MVEIIRAVTDMVKEVGILAAMTIAVFAAALVIGWWYKQSNDALATLHVKLLESQTIQAKRTQDSLDLSTAALNTNSIAMNNNTNAVASQSKLLEKFGSDPSKLCRAMDALRESGIACTAGDVAKILERMEKQGKLQVET